MNTDIRIKTTFPHHIKTRKLIRKLGYKGFYCLINLWCYAAVNKPKGILDIPIEDIAIAADWDEDPETFIDALTRCGFIEKDDGGQIVLHDWAEHNAYASHAQDRSSIARINALIRWGKRPLGSLLRHEDPEVRKEAAKLLNKHRHNGGSTETPTETPTENTKICNGGSDGRGNGRGNGGSQSLDNQGSNASPMQTLCKPYAPTPTPTPSPSPNPYIGMDCHEVCTQSDKSDFVPPNSKIIFSEKDMTFLNLEPYIGKWQDAYPAVDVIQELKAMEAWVASQPKSRWKKDWRRFITYWLAREQDKAELRVATARSNGRRFLDD